MCGTLESLFGQQFDTIIFIDVLKQIEHDREELERAASHLRPGGHLSVLSPAHQRPFSPFDAAIGVFRRYNRPMLRALSPAILRLERLIYLDCAGMILSAANTLLLRQSMPTKAQPSVWDNKTIIGVWRRPSMG